MTWPAFAPLLFLSISNVFMTFAWYGQLRFPESPLWIVVLVSESTFFSYGNVYAEGILRWGQEKGEERSAHYGRAL